MFIPVIWREVEGLSSTPIILCVVVSGVEVGVKVICHSTFRSRYPFKNVFKLIKFVLIRYRIVLGKYNKNIP